MQIVYWETKLDEMLRHCFLENRENTVDSRYLNLAYLE